MNLFSLERLLPFLFLSFLNSSFAYGDKLNGTALTSRYWDCCKPSCGWKAKADVSNPVRSCDVDGNALKGFDDGTGCNGGTAYACSNQQPWAVNDTFSYGFAGAFIKGGSESTWCCSCYRLEFTSGNLTGKTMLVQTTNTDYDIVTDNMFALGIPGGNTSYSNTCAAQFGVDANVFGADHAGVSSRDDCDNLPEPQKPGCYWRFDWFQDASLPTVNFTRVTCPSELTDITGCVRHDDSTFTTSGSCILSRNPFALAAALGLTLISQLF